MRESVPVHALLLILLTTIFCTAFFVFTSTDRKWKKELIEAGFAEYDRKTGVWGLRTAEQVAQDYSLFGPMTPENKE